MPFTFKLSKRLALMKTSLAASAVLTLACTSDLTDPQPHRNSLTPVAISADLTPLAATGVVASGYQDPNVPQNTLDNNLATRWSANGDGQWIRYDLGAVMAVGAVDIAWYQGTAWASAFEIQVSLDTLTWTPVFSGRSSGQTLQPERYDFSTVTGRYIQIVGHGQWSGTTLLSLWNSITEVAIYGSAAPTLSPVSVATVLASGYQDPNVPQNTLDNNLATRWSANGDGQWIRYDLGAVMAVGAVDIAWYQGTAWASAFEIQVSLDTLTWTPVFSGQSSGQTLQPERYDFSTVTGRYVRIVGHGQWSGTTLLSLWNSITEVAIYASPAAPVSSVPVAAVVASGYQDPNGPQNTLDNNLATRWSANGDGQWIRYDLGAVMAVGAVDIAWYQGTAWASAFEIQVSLDTLTWTPVFSGRSSGQTLQPERYDFSTVTGRYIQIVGHGQWSGTTLLSLWNSITEVAIYGSAAPTLSPVSVATVLASGYQDPNVPQNTLDNNLATRWSANGDGQWIRYDLGAVMAVGAVDIEWYQGTAWASAFEIQVSLDTVTWTPVFSGQSSGQTLQPERYDFSTVTGRYVRIVGHGQWSGTTLLRLWNSITEVAIYASPAAPVSSVPVAAVVASGYQDPNGPQNTLDNNLATRWSANGDGQWIRYDLGAVMAVGAVDIAWYQGTAWASAFEIQVSLDTLTWTPVFSGQSSGQTLQPERYDFPT